MLRIAFVGAGGIARAHAKALQDSQKGKIVGVIDRNRDTAESFAAEYNVCVFENLDQCFSKIDVVYVLTPPSFHREYSVQAMKAGKPVLCEKPLATELRDGEIMVETARREGVKLMTAFNQRFRRGFKRLKEIADSGCLGDAISYWCQRLGPSTPAKGNWRCDPELLCGMSVESLSHDIDMLRWLVGDVTSVNASIYESVPAYPGFDDNATSVMTLENGGSATIHASWSSQLGRNSRGIIGTKGTAYLEGPGLWTLQTFRWKTMDMDEAAEENIDDDDFSYAAESDYFLDCIMNDRELMITGEDGLIALKISLAMLKSHQKGIRVSLLDNQVGS